MSVSAAKEPRLLIDLNPRCCVRFGRRFFDRAAETIERDLEDVRRYWRNDGNTVHCLVVYVENSGRT